MTRQKNTRKGQRSQAVSFNTLLFGAELLFVAMYLGSYGSRKLMLFRHTEFNLILKNLGRQTEFDPITHFSCFIVIEAEIHHHNMQGKLTFKRQDFSFLDFAHAKVKISKRT